LKWNLIPPEIQAVISLRDAQDSKVLLPSRGDAQGILTWSQLMPFAIERLARAVSKNPDLERLSKLYAEHFQVRRGHGGRSSPPRLLGCGTHANQATHSAR